MLFMNDLVSKLPKGVQSAHYADDIELWCSGSEEYATTAKYGIHTVLDMAVSWVD